MNALGSQIDLFAVLREEILAVVSRHVSVDPEKVQVTVDRRAKFSTLAVDIEIPNIGGNARVIRVPSSGDTARHRDAAAPDTSEALRQAQLPTVRRSTAATGAPQRPAAAAADGHLR